MHFWHAVEFIETKCRARCLLYAGYKYTLNWRGRDGQCYWRCQDRACHGRATTDENDRLSSTSDTHTHQPNQVEVAPAKVIDSIKTRARTRARSETTPIPQIHQEAVCRDESVSAIASFPGLPRFLSFGLRSVYTTLNANRRTKNGVGLGTRLYMSATLPT